MAKNRSSERSRARYTSPLPPWQSGRTISFFFFKQKTAYQFTVWLEFRRVLFRSHPEADDDRLFRRLAEIRPQAWPNSMMIGFADDLLGRQGRMTAALWRLYARQLAARPHLADTMRGIGRGREVDMALLAKDAA